MTSSNATPSALPVETQAETTIATTAAPGGMNPDMPVGSQKDALMMNVGMIFVLGILFYVLLIRPQQKRFKQHAAMLGGLDRGTKVVTQGGLVGTIDKVISDHEVVLDFGNNVKMTMMRSYILGRYEDSLPTAKVANDVSKKKDKNSK